MSAPTSPDRSGRAPLVKPGPSAPAVPTGNSANSFNPRFEFLPDAPMKRPPPDPMARVFVASEHTEAVLAAQSEALRHRTPSTLKRVTSDMREGAHLGITLVAEAGRRAVHLLAVTRRAVANGVRAAWAVVARSASAAVSRSRAIAVAAGRATGRGVTLLCRGVAHHLLGAASATAQEMRHGVHVLAVSTRVALPATTRILLAMCLVLLVAGRAVGHGLILLYRGAASSLDGVASATAHGMRRATHALTVSAPIAWRWATRIVLATCLVLLAVGLALAAIVVGVVGAGRSGIAFLLRALRPRPRAPSRGADLESIVTPPAPRAPSPARRLSADVARLRVTVRWHGRSARPIIGAVMAAFVGQIVRTTRLTRPQPTRAAMAVAVALIGVAAYASLNREARPAPSTPPAPAKEAPGSPTLASVVPAPSAADTLDVLRTVKGRSIEKPAAETRSTRPGEPVSPVAASASADESLRKSDAMLGSLLVASAPKGAKVSVDGIPRGQSPVAVRRLRAGNRLVRVELDGYQRWSWAVYVTPSRQTKVNVSLVPENGTSPSSAVTNAAAFAK